MAEMKLTMITPDGTSVIYEFGKGPQATGRHCGDCDLCCRLLPVRELGKAAGVRCQHLKSARNTKGHCQIYNTERFPASCALWSCRWLVDPDCRLPRPDRVHYVIDIVPDAVELGEQDGTRHRLAVIQLWVDPAYPDAHRDKRLREWLAKQCEETGMACLVRYNSKDAFLLVPPARAADNEWHEVRSDLQPVQGPLS